MGMSKMSWGGVVACLLMAGGAAAVAVTPQDGTLLPGQPTQARVLILNRGNAEAVPVSIENTAQPLRVDLSSVPTVILAQGTTVQTRATRQTWEYRGVKVGAGQNAAALLNAEGTDGWETAGFTLPDPSGTIVILKRPR
jgi:hypothetical protein